MRAVCECLWEGDAVEPGGGEGLKAQVFALSHLG